MTDDIFSYSSTAGQHKQTEKVWSKGEVCCVKWSEDGKIYNGRIKRIQRCHDADKILALVSFDGFGPEDDEEFDVLELYERKPKPSSCRKGKSRGLDSGFFLPLTGTEDDKRIENKYSIINDVYEDSTENSTSSDNQEKITHKASRRKKMCVVSGGGHKSKTTKQIKINKKVKDCEASTSQTLVDDVITRINPTIDFKDDNHEFSGFSEDDLEKPKFSFKPSASKVPFVLSCGNETPLIQVPATINQYLRDYQRDGIQFLYSHYILKKGAILGDDMGLGKTVQVIGFLAAILNKQGNRLDVLKQKPTFIKKLSDTTYFDEERSLSPFLIIGPGSVLYNWLDELETWGYFTASKYHGADKETCLAEVRKGKLEIVVTSFETFRDNMKELCSIDWQAVIVDEVHRIKDVKSLTTKALRKIPTELRYGLTGTALQNNIAELWSILDWAQPGVLGSINEFNQEFVKPIERGQRTDSTKRELAEARKRKEKFSEIRKKMMIRRMKTLIADQLPKKDDNVVFCKLSNLQTTVYKAILNHPDLELVLKMDEPCNCGSEKSRGRCCFSEASDGSTVQSLKFSFMHLLMKVANHVALLIPREDTSKLQTTRAAEICELALKDHQEFVNLTNDATFRTLSDPKYCGKMKILQGLLQVFDKTHSKVLIFSLSTKVLDILEQYLISSCYEFRRLDGSVSNKRRMELVREFNKTPNIFIFLISTKAGGLGLNLTGANRVVIFDPNWNPSHDLQAQDRAHRIGQRQNVQVYRLISAGTIEENIYLRQIYKQQLGNVVVSSVNAKRLFHGVQGVKHKQGELFGVKNMFQLRTGESCLTMDILERNAKVEAGLNGFDMTKYIPSTYESQASSPDTDHEITDNRKSESSTDSEEFCGLFNSNDEDEVDGSIKIVDNSFVNRTPTRKSSSKSVQSYKRSTSPVAGPSKPYEKRKKTNQRKLRKQSSKTDEPLLQSFASVGDVLGQSGILHVHANVKVIGTSKAEDYMSRCAIQDVYELHQNSQVPAAQCDPLSEPSRDEEILSKKKLGRKGSKTKVDHNTPKTLQHEATKILVGQTPIAIKSKQFEKISEFQDGKSLLELAEEIVRGNTEDRMNLLKSFYLHHHPELREIITSVMSVSPPVDLTPSTPANSKKGKVNLLDKSTKKSLTCRKHLNKTSNKHAAGVSFLESSVSDSESQSLTPPNVAFPSQNTDGSSLDIGIKPSPFQKRRLQQSKKNMNLRSSRGNVKRTFDGAGLGMSAMFDQTGNDNEESGSERHSDSTNIIGPTWLEEDSILYDNMVVISNPSSKNLDQLSPNKANKLKQIDNQSTTPEHSNDNVTELIKEMAIDIEDINLQMKHKDTNKSEIITKHKGDYKSVLDDFFTDEEQKLSPIKNQKWTKSEDQKNAFKHPKRSTDDLFADWDDITCSESTINSETKSDLFNNSTLNDDSIDCFADPSKWKKRSKVKLSVSKKVDKFLQESDDDYEKLFRCGKLKRKKTQQNSDKSETNERNRADNVYKTPSLFSL